MKTTEFTQIISGLSGDETVVTEGNYSLPDGSKVEIKEDENEDKKMTKRKMERKLRLHERDSASVK